MRKEFERRVDRGGEVAAKENHGDGVGFGVGGKVEEVG